MEEGEVTQRMHVAKRFVQWRAEKNLSQKDIATAIGRKEEFVSEVESAKMGFSQLCFQTLRLEFGLDINWLFDGIR